MSALIKHHAPTLICTCSIIYGSACSESPGRLDVLVEAESVIQEGLAPGPGVDNIQDDWSVTFDAYVVSIGALELEFSEDHTETAEAPEVFLVDLVQLPSSATRLWTLGGLSPGRWELHYRTPQATEASADSSTSADDAAQMMAGELSYLIRGHLDREDGLSCPPASVADVPDGLNPQGENAGGDTCYANPSINFAFDVARAARFGPCEVDGVPGVAVPAGGTQSAALTIHGDHLFFNGFPEGAEGGVVRLAQWLADCDLNLDGEVSKAELASISPSDLPELDDRFQLGGSPITPLDDMWSYVEAQTVTQGHFQGEGECPAVPD